MNSAAASHKFRVHARHVDLHHARVLVESSFEAAAITYLEDFGHVFGEAREISVIVHNLDDGREHCFRIDLETGETVPCS